MKKVSFKLFPVISFLACGSLLFSSCYKEFDPSSYQPPLSIGGFTSSSEIAPSNLIGYWPFDETLVDNVTGNAGTNAGTTFANGIKKQAMDGADNSYVLFTPGSEIINMESFTISCWVNSPQNTDGIVGLIDLSNTSAFWGNIDIFFENGSTADKALLKIHVTNNGVDAWLGNYELLNIWNIWTNISVTYDAATSTFNVYVNGSNIATQTIDGYGPLNFTNVGDMVFGTVQFQTTPSLTSASGSQDWAGFLLGLLDEVRIYNKALSDDEVGALVKLEGRGK